MNATGQATKQETGVVSQSNRAPESRLIVSCGDAGVASDYCKFLNESSVCRTALAAGSESQTPAASVMRLMRSDTEFKQLTAEEFTSHSCDTPFCTHEVVVFLEPGVTSRTMSVFAKLSQLSMRNHVGCLIVVPSLKNHLADSRCDDLQPLLDKLGDVFRQRNSTTSSPSENSGPGLVILRTGYVLSPSSSLTRRSRSLSGFKRILSDRMTTTFVEGRSCLLRSTKSFEIIGEELKLVRGKRGMSIPRSQRAQRSHQGTYVPRSPKEAAICRAFVKSRCLAVAEAGKTLCRIPRALEL